MFLSNYENILPENLDSLLFNYIRKEIGVSYRDHILYSDDYTNGTLTCKTLPKLENRRIKTVNGFPHFEVPKNVLLLEIESFLNKDFFVDIPKIVVLGGDTHIDKPIPKLAQYRGIILSSVIRDMYESIGIEVENIYLIGDIGKRVEKYIEDNFNCIPSNTTKYSNLIESLNETALDKITKDVSHFDVEYDDFVFISDIVSYSDKYIKSNFKEEKEVLRKDGSLKYLGQELSLLFFLKRNYESNPILMLGGNQRGHADRVINFIKKKGLDLDVSYFIFEKVLNADERGQDKWENKIKKHISRQDFKDINPNIFVKLIFTVFRQDSIQDIYSSVNLNILRDYQTIIRNIKNDESGSINYNKKVNKEALYKMSLVNYQIFRACSSYNPKIFFDYIVDIAKLIDKEKGKMKKETLELSRRFLAESLKRINLF
jgi:hypothetical protein